MIIFYDVRLKGSSNKLILYDGPLFRSLWMMLLINITKTRPLSCYEEHFSNFPDTPHSKLQTNNSLFLFKAKKQPHIIRHVMRTGPVMQVLDP